MHGCVAVTLAALPLSPPGHHDHLPLCTGVSAPVRRGAVADARLGLAFFFHHLLQLSPSTYGSKQHGVHYTMLSPSTVHMTESVTVLVSVCTTF